MDSTYSNLGTADMWRNKKSILNRGNSRVNVNDAIFNDKVQRLNKMHGNYLDEFYANMEQSLNTINQAQEKYNSLSMAVENTIRLVEQSERNGNVESDAAGGTYSAKTSASSSLESNTMEGMDRGEAMEITNVPSSSLASSPMGEQSISAATTIGAVSGENIGSSSTDASSSGQAISTSAVSGAGISSSLTSLNAFGDQAVGSGTWGRLSSIEQVNAIMKLKEVGYTQEEIKQIISGAASVPKVEVMALADSLKEKLLEHPELRQDIINQYGFDIFNEDGSVDYEKLALALVIDQKEENDQYSLIEYLHSKYGIDIVNQEEYNSISHKIEELMITNPEVREKILEQYGFDIFDKDGNIGRRPLTLALLMDKENENDEYDLLKIILNYEKKNEVNHTIVGVKTLSGVNLLGVTPKGSSLLSGNGRSI